jgi:hypothetical protein
MISAIMPCRGRTEQTIDCIKRLLAMAGRVEWQLIAICDGDLASHTALAQAGLPIRLLQSTERHGYWPSINAATVTYPAPLLVNLANDLLPGRDWLARGYAAYRNRFGEGDGLMGFNDGLHGPHLSPHFLISRGLLDRYGGWPIHYQHTHGDVELCLRAQQDQRYGKAPWAVLYHNHPYLGAETDGVYAEGEASIDADYTLFHQRRERGWK